MRYTCKTNGFRHTQSRGIRILSPILRRGYWLTGIFPWEQKAMQKNVSLGFVLQKEGVDQVQG